MLVNFIHCNNHDCFEQLFAVRVRFCLAFAGLIVLPLPVSSARNYMPSCQERLVRENNAHVQILGSKSGPRLVNPQEDITELVSGLKWHFSYKALFGKHLILFRKLLSKLKPHVCEVSTYLCLCNAF